MTQASNYYIRRLEKAVRRRHKRIAKMEAKLASYKVRHEAGKINRAQLQQKSQTIEIKMRGVKARMQTYQGAISKERRRIEHGEPAN